MKFNKIKDKIVKFDINYILIGSYNITYIIFIEDKNKTPMIL